MEEIAADNLVSIDSSNLLCIGTLGANKQSSVQRAGDMILFNTLTDGEYRTMNNTLPRLLESSDDRVKFIAAIRSPVARDVLNFDVRNILSLLKMHMCANREKSTR